MILEKRKFKLEKYSTLIEYLEQFHQAAKDNNPVEERPV